MDELKLDVLGFQNIEMEVARFLKTIKGSTIENIFLDDSGKLTIYYSFKNMPETENYVVKQVSKRKYSNIEEFIENFLENQRHDTNIFKRKWVIEFKKIWLVFFEF